MNKFVTVNEISSVLNTRVGKIKIGSLFQNEGGNIYLQAFKGGQEGIAVYGILDTNYIELNNPVGFIKDAYLHFNEKTNKVETIYL